MDGAAKRPILFLGVCCLLLAACSNRPGNLVLELATERAVIKPTDPIVLDVKLSALSDPVCLAKGYDFRVEMHRKDDKLVLENRAVWVCGTAVSDPLTSILYPLFAAVHLLDMGDLSGRFEVIARGQPRENHLQIVQDSSDRLSIVEAPASDQEARVPWEPGEYILKVALTNTEPAFYHAPLFWLPFSHPVESEIQIVVEGE